MNKTAFSALFILLSIALFIEWGLINAYPK
jgi:hypothetical protein